MTRITTTSWTAPPHRLTSMDAFRGLVMICLAAEGFGLAATAKNFPDSPIWQSIGYQFEHVQWVGCALWDLIQPSFMFLVGVAVPYSFSRRESAGQSSKSIVAHVLTRSFVLICLGLFLSSGNKPTTNFTFMNVLTQIGLGYPFLFLLRNRKPGIQLAVATGILFGYWAWFVMTPVVPIENLKEANLPEDWKLLKNFKAHWQKHKNAAAYVDSWFLNIFPPLSVVSDKTVNEPVANQDGTVKETNAESVPTTFGWIWQVARRLITRPEPYVFNGGGYQTLNFVPEFVTMLFGLMAGEFIRRASFNSGRTFLTLFLAGIVLIGLGWGWSAIGGCPLVKRIWTPSWTLYSTGLTLLILSGFYGVIDGMGFKAWSFPLIVAGMNSMVMYMLGQLLHGWTRDLLKRHINENLFLIFGNAYAPIVEASLVLLTFWLFVYWLYRQRIFVRL